MLVDFYATWCGPCKMMPPILQELKNNVGDAVKVVKIDVDKNQTVAQRFGVRSVPTLILFKQGKVAWRTAGVHPAHELEKVLRIRPNPTCGANSDGWPVGPTAWRAPIGLIWCCTVPPGYGYWLPLFNS